MKRTAYVRLQAVIFNSLRFLPIPDREPKDTVVAGWDAHGGNRDNEATIVSLVDGVYAPSKLSASAIFDARKAKAVREAAKLKEEGKGLMSEKKYEAAAAKFVKASQMDDSIRSPLYLNNAGYAYYQMGRYETSLGWLVEAIREDPKRAIAYLNRGDVFVALHHSAMGRQDYQTYLEDYCVHSDQPCIAEARKDYAKFLENAASAIVVKACLRPCSPSTPSRSRSSIASRLCRSNAA